VTIFGAGAAAQILLKVSGAAHIGGPPILACLALAIGYAVRMRRTVRQRGRTA